MNPTVGVEDFSAGIYRGREAPRNAAYDLLNLLIDDEGQPYRRGGSKFYGTDSALADSPLEGLVDVSVYGGRRTVAWRIATVTPPPMTTGLYLFRQGTTFVFLGEILEVSEFDPLQRFVRPVVVGGLLIFPTASGLGLYGGSEKAANYATGTITVTNGSAIVTGVGTTFTGSVDRGMLLAKTGSVGVGVVKSVDSNTQITLKDPWTGVTSGPGAYTLSRVRDWAVPTPTGRLRGVAAAGSLARLFAYQGAVLQFSPPGKPLDLGATAGDLHVLPNEGDILGAEGVGDRLYIFNADGMWALDGLDFDPVDDAGNIQHAIRQLNEIILWADAGIAKWRGAIIVPAIDGVWLVSSDAAPIRLGDGIGPLYRSYVEAGHRLGQAVVHRSHYFLPIVSEDPVSGVSVPVDVLVCRLDRPFGGDYQGWPWTRLSGHAAGNVYAQRVDESTGAAKLLSADGSRRVTDLTGCFTPSAASEADGSVHPIVVETRDLATPGGGRGSTTRKVRVRYEAAAAAAPSFTMSYARGLEGTPYTSLGDAIRGGAASDGLDESVWPVGKQAPAIRFRLESSSALSSFKLRGIAAEYTPRGM